MSGLRRAVVTIACVLGTLGAACAPKTSTDAEAKKDVKWLATDGSPESIAALGRLADTDPKALGALEDRAGYDVNVFIAAWQAVLRDQGWGDKVLRSGLADPTRAEMAASSMPRNDIHLAPFVNELEGAVVRLAAGKRGSVVAGVLASVGVAAHPAVERRLLDPKTRSAMCDGIGLPEASPDARALVLKVPPEARDHTSCVDLVLRNAAQDETTLAWLARSGEPGLFGAAARRDMPCPKLAAAWKRALVERPVAEHGALVVPLRMSVSRCSVALDPVLADLLATAPGARACIIQAIEPFSQELTEMKATCKTLAQRWTAAESQRNRERVADALQNACRRAR
jgi:hypothetical protein